MLFGVKMKNVQIKAEYNPEYNQSLEIKPVEKSGKRPGYASLPARSLGQSLNCFSARILPRLRAGSDAYPN